MYGAIAYNAYYMVKDAEEQKLEGTEESAVKKEPLKLTLNKFINKNFGLITKNFNSEFYLLLLIATSFTMFKALV